MTTLASFATGVYLFISSLFGGAVVHAPPVAPVAPAPAVAASSTEAALQTTPTAPIGFEDWQWYPLGTSFGETDDYYQNYRLIGNKMYFQTGDKVTSKAIPSAATSSFQFTFSKSSGVSLNCAKDATHVYWEATPLPDADPATFTPIIDADGNLTRFGKDHTHVYFNGSEIPGADPSSFYVATTTNSAYNMNQSSHDKNASYFGTMRAVPVTTSTTAPTPKTVTPTAADGYVTGYIWTANPGSPLFASIEMSSPDDQEHTYKLYIWNGHSFDFYADIQPLLGTAGNKVTFPAGGVSKFEILGIEPSLSICGADRAFLFGISFATTGKFDGTREAVTDGKPNATCAARNAQAIQAAADALKYQSAP